MREAVVFKGARDGLQLVIDETADFHSIFEQLKGKLEAAADFFTAGTSISICPAAEKLPGEQREEIIQLLAQHGLEYQIPMDEPVCAAPETVSYEGIGYEAQSLVVAKTLRGGQKVTYHGSIIIIGDVNPNAEVIAGGNIIVMGACRGTVHAGAYGDCQASITAGQLMAAQIRIAGLIARAPDHSTSKPDFIETARIINGAIVIECLKR